MFYVPDAPLHGRIQLSETESQHCIKVLRHQVGDTITLIDGKGYEFHAAIIHPNHKRCEVEITSMIEHLRPARNIHIAVAPLKSGERMDWMLEKLVELGVTHINFIETERTERSLVKAGRLEKVAVAALKQCKRFWLPEISPLLSFKKYIHSELPEARFIGHCEDQEKKNIAPGKHVSAVLLIGPEGDFTPIEIQSALDAGFIPVSLSDGILRTETAAITGAVMLMNNE